MLKTSILTLALVATALTACTNSGGGAASTTNPDGTPVDIMSDFPASPRDTFALNLESQSVKSDVSTAELLAVFEARNRTRDEFENSKMMYFDKSSKNYGIDGAEKDAKLAIATNCEVVRGKDLDPNFESGSSNGESISRISGASCPVDITMKSNIGFQSNLAAIKANPDDKSAVLLGQVSGSTSETRTVRDASLRDLLDETSSRNTMSVRGTFNASGFGSSTNSENLYMRAQGLKETTSASGFVYRISYQAETIKNADGAMTQILVTVTTRAGIIRAYRLDDNRNLNRSTPDQSKMLINGVKPTSSQEYFLRDKIFDEVKRNLRF